LVSEGSPVIDRKNCGMLRHTDGFGNHQLTPGQLPTIPSIPQYRSSKSMIKNWVWLLSRTLWDHPHVVYDPRVSTTCFIVSYPAQSSRSPNPHRPLAPHLHGCFATWELLKLKYTLLKPPGDRTPPVLITQVTFGFHPFILIQRGAHRRSSVNR